MKSLQQFLEAQKFLIKGHTKDQSDAIDLDLPSGINWATCNIGANKPEYYGLLFQWGRVDGYSYGDKNNKFLSADDYVTASGTKYKKGETLKPEDDAAYQATKGKFRMPTIDEIDELIKHTDNEWTELNGVKGRKFISKKDNKKWIFIPAIGVYDGNQSKFYNFGSDGYIWSSSANTDDSSYADFLYVYPGDGDSDISNTNNGQSVRGVLNK